MLAEIRAHYGTEGKKFRNRYAIIFSTIAIIIATLIILNYFTGSKIPFEKRAWVLITDFGNRTKVEGITTALNNVLERELSRSAYVNIVPRGRIFDVLGLMRKNINTEITLEIAREICIRDGNIKAILSGGMNEVGGVYEIFINVIEPGNGSIIHTVSELCSRQDEIFPAIRKIAVELRKALGESLDAITRSEKNLEKVTTPSLKALRYYSRGWDYLNQFNWVKTKLMFEQAIKEDSSFAMCYTGLGFAQMWLGQPDESKNSFKKALEFAKFVTDREKYFIEGSYYAYGLNDYEKAIAPYELLIKIYPDDYWAHENLSQCYTLSGDVQKAILHSKETKRIRPNYAVNHFDLGLLALYSENNINKAHEEFKKGLKLNPDYPIEVAQLADFFLYWMNDEHTSAERELKDFFDYKVNKLLPEFKVTAYWFISRYYNYMGNYSEANRLIGESIKTAEENRLENYSAWSKLELALNYQGRGNNTDAVTILKEIEMNSKGCVRVEALGWMAFIAAANRKRSDAEKYVSKMQKENGRMIFDVIHPFLPKELKKIKNSFSHLVFGKMSERENNYNQAIQEYQWVIDNIAPNQIPVMTSLKPVLRIFALNSLAQIYEKQGNESEALKLYNEILKHKTLNITQSSCAIIWRDLIRKISENKE